MFIFLVQYYKEEPYWPETRANAGMMKVFPFRTKVTSSVLRCAGSTDVACEKNKAEDHGSAEAMFIGILQISSWSNKPGTT